METKRMFAFRIIKEYEISRVYTEDRTFRNFDTYRTY